MRASSLSCLAVAAALLVAADVQARSYVLVAPNDGLPTNLEAAVAAAGGTVTLPQIGVALAESSSASFAARAEKISGTSSALPDVRYQTVQPLAILL